jgi:hypothetical protein
MSDTLSTLLARNYARGHARALALARGLGDEEFARSVAPSLHGGARQLWHMARWTDVFAAILVDRSHALAANVAPMSGGTSQVWERDGLAAARGLTTGALGRQDTGMLLSDEAAENVELHGRATVIDYAERALASVSSWSVRSPRRTC